MLVCLFSIDPRTQSHDFTRSSLSIGGSFRIRERESRAIYGSVRFLKALTNTTMRRVALFLAHCPHSLENDQLLDQLFGLHAQLWKLATNSGLFENNSAI